MGTGPGAALGAASAGACAVGGRLRLPSNAASRSNGDQAESRKTLRHTAKVGDRRFAAKSSEIDHSRKLAQEMIWISSSIRQDSGNTPSDIVGSSGRTRSADRDSANSGLMLPPWIVATSLRVRFPSSSTPALSHFRTNRTMRRSRTRCSMTSPTIRYRGC